MTQYTVIDSLLLGDLAREARQSPRLRKNRNFHGHDADICHRLLNALEPGTYIQPHCHLAADKEETIIALSGRIGILIFDAEGNVHSVRVLAPGSGTVGINIPPGTFHSLVALEPGSIFFESKAGPYVPIVEAERAAWAPKEGEASCPDYLAFMLGRFGRKN